MLFVGWSRSEVSRFRLTISLQNQKGVLADLLTRLSDLDLNILSIELGIQSSEQAEFCQIEVEGTKHNRNQIKEEISQKFKLIEIISLDDAYNK